MKRTDIKPGMIIHCTNKEKYIIVQSGGLHMINMKSKCGIPLNTFFDDNLNPINKNLPELVEIRDSISGALIYKRMVIELSLQQIADKFNISVEQLRIKR